MAAPGGPFYKTPGSLTAPAFAEVVYRGHTVESNGGNRPTLNVYHFLRRPSVTAPVEVSLMNAVAGVVDAPLSAAYSNTYVADSMSGRFMDNPASLAVSQMNAIAGAITGDRMPSGNGAVTVQLKTNGRGANYRGSKHFSPIAESDTTLDNLNAGAITRWTAVSAALNSMSGLVDSDGNVWDQIVLSQDLSELTATPALFTGAYVVNTVLNQQVGTMRRRRQKSSVV